MKSIIRFVSAGQAAVLGLMLATPAFAQTATPSSESTQAALPQAGTASTTLLILVFGVVVVLTGVILSLRNRSEVKV